MSSFTEGRAKHPRTPAQWYCLLVGATLLLVGLLGFIADTSFDTGGDTQLNGDSFLGFEVNGWHNVVHLASGALLLAAANTAPTAKTVAIAFGVVYGLVAIVGLVDGQDVLGLIPVNAADNVLHIVLSAVGIAAGLGSRTFRRELRRTPGAGRPDGPTLVGTDADRVSQPGEQTVGERFIREERDGAIAGDPRASDREVR